MPQAVAHRGYKAKYPENTMAAFEGAVEVGVHALETDVHLSRDGVVVLSHVRIILQLLMALNANGCLKGCHVAALLWRR